VLLHPQTGFPRRGEIDVEGIRTVIDIRRSYGEPRRQLSAPEAYYDLSHYDRAVSNP
jgi:hypothetical protein